MKLQPGSLAALRSTLDGRFWLVAGLATAGSLLLLGVPTCVNRIEGYRRNAEGVVEANVNLATESASVRYDPARVAPAGT